METIGKNKGTSPPGPLSLRGEGEITDRAGASNGRPARDESEAQARWVSPGVSVRKRILTGIGVALAAAVFFAIARWQGASMLVSTVIGIIFIGCFVWYLTIVAPRPFTLALDAGALTRTDAGKEPEVIPWTGMAKVKEEVFKSGKSVSLTVYKRVGERGLHKAWAVYRDDVPRFDELLAAVRAALPESVPWIRETVHE
ncbi:MAG TPA: hypothetical protein VJQ45_12485 [Ktedonobacterales bacterium]|nr:hypothetical protein [Ktedonobacterales bacterium]